ncbi:MAG: hypothetical protein D6729_14200 [Deltaproteobacteria bacterium]|nr:MAG: hypothetical protein D6729_14200 [Deltaproteobacteria bacterium]
MVHCWPQSPEIVRQVFGGQRTRVTQREMPAQTPAEGGLPHWALRVQASPTSRQTQVLVVLSQVRSWFGQSAFWMHSTQRFATRLQTGRSGGQVAEVSQPSTQAPEMHLVPGAQSLVVLHSTQVPWAPTEVSQRVWLGAPLGGQRALEVQPGTQVDVPVSQTWPRGQWSSCRHSTQVPSGEQTWPVAQ